MNIEQEIGGFIGRPYFRLAFIILCLILLAFVAFKEGFSMWILSKLRWSSERMTPCPPSQSPNIIGMCR